MTDEIEIADSRHLRAVVESELRSMLERVIRIDLASVHRAIVTLIGAHAGPHIPEAVSQLVHSGIAALETEHGELSGLSVGYLRRQVDVISQQE